MVYVIDDPLYPGANYSVTYPRVTGDQLVTLTGTGLGGTFQLAYKGLTTLPIPFDATAGQIRNALEVLTGLGVGNLTVTGSAGGPWTITSHSPIKPDVFITPRLGYLLTGLTGTGVSISVDLPVQDTTGFTYELQARSHPPEPSTPDILITQTLTSQGQITNHGATGLIDLVILGSWIETLNFGYTEAPANATAQYLILETQAGVPSVFMTGTFVLKPRVYQP